MMSLVNEVEIYLLIGAVLFSKARVIPALLALYSLFYSLISNLSDQMLTYCNKAYEVAVKQFGEPTTIILDKCDQSLMNVYLFEGLMMFLVSLLFVFVMGRLAKVAFLVIATQSALSFLMAICVYVVNKTNEPLDFAFDAHYSINTNFAIIYIVIAWTCVLLSWRESK